MSLTLTLKHKVGENLLAMSKHFIHFLSPLPVMIQNRAATVR